MNDFYHQLQRFGWLIFVSMPFLIQCRRPFLGRRAPNQILPFRISVRWLVTLLLFGGMFGSANAGAVTYIYTDQQGTVLAEADSNGAISASFDYRPYGSAYSGEGMSSVPDGPGYTGHVMDQDAALVYMQARYYDEAVGRFISVDPIGIGPGQFADFSRFSYAGNNPIRNMDPTGMECTGSNITDKNGNCPDSGKSTVNSGPSSGGVAQRVKNFVVGVAKVAINKAEDAFGALGDSEASQMEPLKPVNKAQAAGGVFATVVFGAASVAATDGESAELSADELLASANQLFNESGITKAARAWEKHGGRSDGMFPALTGNIQQKNSMASQFVEDVLTNPATVRTPLSRGGVQYRLPDGRGVRFNSGGKFSGFLDPKRP